MVPAVTASKRVPADHASEGWGAPAVVRDAAEVTLALFYVCDGHPTEEVAEHLHIAPTGFDWMLGMEIRRLTGTTLPVNDCVHHIADLGLSPQKVVDLAGRSAYRA